MPESLTPTSTIRGSEEEFTKASLTPSHLEERSYQVNDVLSRLTGKPLTTIGTRISGDTKEVSLLGDDESLRKALSPKEALSSKAPRMTVVLSVAKSDVTEGGMSFPTVLQHILNEGWGVDISKSPYDAFGNCVLELGRRDEGSGQSSQGRGQDVHWKEGPPGNKVTDVGEKRHLELEAEGIDQIQNRVDPAPMNRED